MGKSSKIPEHHPDCHEQSREFKSLKLAYIPVSIDACNHVGSAHVSRREAFHRSVAKDGLANRSRLLALPKGIETMSSDAVISVSEECNALRQSPEEPLSMMHGARRGMPSNNSRPGTKTMATGGLANDATASIHCEASLHDKSEDSVAMVGSQFPSQATLRPNEILTGSKARQLKKLEPVFITARSNSKTLRTYLSDDSDERKYRMSRGKLA